MKTASHPSHTLWKSLRDSHIPTASTTGNICLLVPPQLEALLLQGACHAGYFLGHLDGLELTLEDHAPRVSELFLKHPQIHPLIVRLCRVLHELWLSEYAWQSIEIFTPIYDLIREMMALHGMAFARHQDEWRIVMCEDE